MIVEGGLLLGSAYYLYRKANKEEILKKKRIASIRNKWSILMDGIGNKAENKIEQQYEMLDIIEKHYGFDAIISIPIGKSLKDLRQLIPQIDVLYKANTICEYSKDKNSAYMRVWFNGKDISPSDLIKFKWYSCFQGNNDRNTSGETYKLTNSVKITNPNDKKKKIVGYRYNIIIPNGLDYNTLKSYEDNFNKTMGKSLVKWNNDTNMAEIEIITSPLGDLEPFVPIKPKTPYDFYLAMTYGYNPIFTSLNKNPHILVTGQSQTGKTMCVLTGITNTAYFYNEDDFILFESMISAKQDLRIFSGLRQCMYYATDIKESLKMFKYVLNLLYERNRTFETSKEFCGNMYDWNKMYPNKKMPIVIMAVDEMTLYSPMKSDSEKIKKMKVECEDIIRQLIIEGASAGINVIFSLQRPDKEAFPPHIKSQCGTRCGFYQGNTASSLVAMDDDSCSRLAMKREAIIKYSEGTELVKTLYLTHSRIEELLKDKIIGTEHHLKLDNNGKKIEEKPNVDTNKNEEITDKKAEKLVENTLKDKKRNSGRFKNLTQKKGK